MTGSRTENAASEDNTAKFADVTPHRQFEYRWNQLQFTIELVVAIIIVSALAGLLGTGPLSSSSASVPGGKFGMSYDRIVRRTVQSKVVFTLDKPADAEKLTIIVPNDFLDHVSVQGMEPRASEVRADAHGIAYSFKLGAMRMGRIAFDVKPSSPGLYTAAFEVDGVPVTLHQLILP